MYFVYDKYMQCTCLYSISILSRVFTFSHNEYLFHRYSGILTLVRQSVHVCLHFALCVVVRLDVHVMTSSLLMWFLVFLDFASGPWKFMCTVSSCGGCDGCDGCGCHGCSVFVADVTFWYVIL